MLNLNISGFENSDSDPEQHDNGFDLEVGGSLRKGGAE